ncbi:Hypothetical predicted protein [Paramuricea clavata]|uniref:Uncharacterized protein n=1 Tax=Paramuricea clavata TaxID=317549 RepID=A0A7D9HUK3_PARCT|nr:Hypothetical predicted protein [Paramuricea clavata]
MKSQQQAGGQSNDTLSLCTKLDWCLPNVLQGDRMIKEVANLYINGDKKKGLKKHKAPVLCERPPTGGNSSKNWTTLNDVENTSEVMNVENAGDQPVQKKSKMDSKVDECVGDEPVQKKPRTDSKVVVKFQPGKSKLVKKQTEAKIMAESEKYFVDQMVVLEEKRINQ